MVAPALDAARRTQWEEVDVVLGYLRSRRITVLADGEDVTDEVRNLIALDVQRAAPAASPPRDLLSLVRALAVAATRSASRTTVPA